MAETAGAARAIHIFFPACAMEFFLTFLLIFALALYSSPAGVGGMKDSFFFLVVPLRLIF